MFQTYEKKDPQGAEDLLANTQKRLYKHFDSYDKIDFLIIKDSC